MLLTLNDYQERAWRTRRVGDPYAFLFGLVSEVGDIHAVTKRRLRQTGTLPDEAREVKEEIGDLLWYLAAVASHFKIKLEEAALQNLEKTEGLFGGEYDLLDSAYHEQEQIPRFFEVEFIEVGGEIDRVEMYVDGRQVGAAIDDNAMKPDGYRWHDVFHLAFVACLGWSPVWRALTTRKRKSDPVVDRTEDGARAAAIEEAVSAYIFEDFKRLGGFHDVKLIPFEMVQTCKRITSNLEVNCRRADDWERAISEGFKAFDEIRNGRGGIVAVDMVARTLTVRQRDR